MTFGAPEAEALLGIASIQGLGVSSIDGSPVPLGLKTTGEPIEIPRSLWGRWKPPMPQDKNPVDQEAKQHQTN
jgi:hypothetical protein